MSLARWIDPASSAPKIFDKTFPFRYTRIASSMKATKHNLGDILWEYNHLDDQDEGFWDNVVNVGGVYITTETAGSWYDLVEVNGEGFFFCYISPATWFDIDNVTTRISCDGEVVTFSLDTERYRHFIRPVNDIAAYTGVHNFDPYGTNSGELWMSEFITDIKRHNFHMPPESVSRLDMPLYFTRHFKIEVKRTGSDGASNNYNAGCIVETV